MRCPNCGSAVTGDGSACPVCGTALGLDEPPHGALTVSATRIAVAVSTGVLVAALVVGAVALVDVLAR